MPPYYLKRFLMAAHFTDDTFQKEVLEAAGLVLVDFFAEWCGPCKMMAPVIDELAEEQKTKVKIGKMDVDSDPAFPGQYGISSIPTLIFFKGGAEVGRLVGFQSKEMLEEKIAALA